MHTERLAVHESWRQQDGQTCLIDDVEFLVQVAELRRSEGQESFVVTLTSESPHAAGQGTAHVRFDDGSSADVFVVPVSETALEAVFTRLTDGEAS